MAGQLEQLLGGHSDGSSFDYPRFIVSDKKGRLYISDSNGVITYKCSSSNHFLYIIFYYS